MAHHLRPTASAVQYAHEGLELCVKLLPTDSIHTCREHLLERTNNSIAQAQKFAVRREIWGLLGEECFPLEAEVLELALERYPLISVPLKTLADGWGKLGTGGFGLVAKFLRRG